MIKISVKMSKNSTKKDEFMFTKIFEVLVYVKEDIQNRLKSNQVTSVGFSKF